VLVVDASLVVNACLSEDGFSAVPDPSLIAPPLLWSEVASVLHEMQWRSAISKELAGIAVKRLDEASIQDQRPPLLRAEAWRIADELGWARTYDAEYLALARLLGCRLMTIDDRLRRGAGHLVEIIGPTGD
jgi:predicted nucleic acid-binding protein